MFFDLSDYKITIIRMNNAQHKYIKEVPIDVPGRVLGLETANDDLIINFIRTNRLLEAICQEFMFERSRLFIRWQNDVKGWYSINNKYSLLRSNYPVLKSIWDKRCIPISKDFRKPEERRPITKRRPIKQLPRLGSKGTIKWPSTLNEDTNGYMTLDTASYYRTITVNTNDYNVSSSSAYSWS